MPPANISCTCFRRSAVGYQFRLTILSFIYLLPFFSLVIVATIQNSQHTSSTLTHFTHVKVAGIHTPHHDHIPYQLHSTKHCGKKVLERCRQIMKKRIKLEKLRLFLNCWVFTALGEIVLSNLSFYVPFQYCVQLCITHSNTFLPPCIQTQLKYSIHFMYMNWTCRSVYQLQSLSLGLTHTRLRVHNITHPYVATQPCSIRRIQTNISAFNIHSIETCNIILFLTGETARHFWLRAWYIHTFRWD